MSFFLFTFFPVWQKRFRAVYDYSAADEDEVSFQDGDTIINVQQIDDGWMYGTVERTGETGMLPANYVEAIWLGRTRLILSHTIMKHSSAALSQLWEGWSPPLPFSAFSLKKTLFAALWRQKRKLPLPSSFSHWREHIEEMSPALLPPLLCLIVYALCTGIHFSFLRKAFFFFSSPSYILSVHTFLKICAPPSKFMRWSLLAPFNL